MWKRIGQRFTSSFWRNITAVSVSTCSAASIITSTTDKTQRIDCNRVLADRHRVALAGWPVHQSKGGSAIDNRINTLQNLTKYLKEAGYEGIELAFEHFENMYFKNSNLSKEEMVNIIRNAFQSQSLSVFGFLAHSHDEDWDSNNLQKHLTKLKEDLYYNKMMGCEYVTFQIWLPQKYLNGDGSYRHDTELLNTFVERIKILQNLAYEQGLNFYVETHVGRLSEDPEAFNKIMNLYNNFEVNGDLSHYICRGMLKGEFVDNILNKMEHTHVRMARVYGDLSVNVDNPIDDWKNGGVTHQYWEFAKNGFKNGLSSRVIVGESGPIHLVEDPLAQDKRMVPLLRAFADYCDQQVYMEKATFNPFDKKAM